MIKILRIFFSRYAHCRCHKQSYGMADTFQHIPEARNCIGSVNSVHYFLNGSAQRKSLFMEIQKINILPEPQKESKRRDGAPEKKRSMRF